MLAIAGIWVYARVLRLDLGAAGPTADRPRTVIVADALLAILSLSPSSGSAFAFAFTVAISTAGSRSHSTLVVFANLHYALAPADSGGDVLQGDFLRLLSFAVLLVRVWRAIGHAEFGRAVAEERGRVAQEIHDGLAQYLFAISTHASMLEGGASLETMLPRLKVAAHSCAAGSAIRRARAVLGERYRSVRRGAPPIRRGADRGRRPRRRARDPPRGSPPAPDEQIEIFRIVQEGLANARRHGESHAGVGEIELRGGRRIVQVRDYGIGFDEGVFGPDAGPGLQEHAPAGRSDRGGSSQLVARPRNRDRGRAPGRLIALSLNNRRNSSPCLRQAKPAGRKALRDRV